MKRIWDDVITERDRLVFEQAGYGQRGGFGERPALLVIDPLYNFVGDKPEPILESIQRFRNSCGEEGWAAIKHIQALLGKARERKIPVFFSTQGYRPDFRNLGAWGQKNRRATETGMVYGNLGSQIVAEVAPRPEEVVLPKDKPSVFFGTPLLSYLVELQIDTLILCGCTTSGCVRATATDAFSYNYRVVIAEEATFDRGQVSHKVSLFDLQQKYADVVPTASVVAHLAARVD